MYNVAYNMLHVMSAQCVACDLHMVVPGQVSVHVGDNLQHSDEIVKNLQLCLSMRSLLLLLPSFHISTKSCEKICKNMSAEIFAFSYSCDLE